MTNSFAADALAGRVAIITGAASGIGRQAAQQLAAMGAHLWLADLNAAGLEETRALVGGTADLFVLDVTDEAGWAELIGKVRAAAVRLDVLVNNAGIMLNKGLMDTSLADWRRQQAINVESIFLGMRTAMPLMGETATAHGVAPSIINVSSIYGIVAGANFSAYSASKGAVRALTRAAATEVVKTGVRINTLCPGPTATNLGAGWDPPVGPDGKPLTEEQIAEFWNSLIPMRRTGAPQDMASAIAFLACDASSYMTGAELIVDGGYIMN